MSAPIYVSGMGKIRATCAVHDMFNRGYDRILLAGYCGGIRGCKKGDIFIPDRIINGDYDVRPLETYPEKISIGDEHPHKLMVSQDRFLTVNPYEFAYDFIATDMESFAVAYTCRKLGLPFTIVKVVSDIVGSNSPEDFIASCKTLAPKLNSAIHNHLTTFSKTDKVN